MIDAFTERARIAHALRVFQASEKRPGALLGFDGYIDKLVRPKRSQAQDDYFSTIREFAGFLGSAGAASSDIAVRRTFEKIGGNGTLLAESLADKGVPVVCIGAMGENELDAPYLALSKKAELYSICKCATSYAFEFDDGKLMFGDTDCFFDISWQRLCDRVGLEKLIGLFQSARLVGFANWSGLPLSTDLMNGILRDICPRLGEKENRSIFFDLADPSGKSAAQFKELFSCLERLRAHFTVAIGLNPKECLQVYRHFFGADEAAFDPAMAESLLYGLPVDELVVHTAGCAYAGLRRDKLKRVPGRYLEKPKISVGAGDNFNAGYCLGRLCGLAPEDCAALGNEAAAGFIEFGAPVSLPWLIEAFAAPGDFYTK